MAAFCVQESAGTAPAVRADAVQGNLLPILRRANALGAEFLGFSARITPGSVIASREVGSFWRGSIPQEKIAEVKASVSISDLIARDVPIAWMRGNRTHFYCTHGGVREKNTSLVAYEDQGTYHCFGCGLHGDQLDWVMSHAGLGFREAVESLA